MPLTPADVHNVAFKKPPIGKRGYDEDEVDSFLDLVEKDLADLIEENNTLKNRPGGSGDGRAAADLSGARDENRRLQARISDLERALSQGKDQTQQQLVQTQQQLHQTEQQLAQTRQQLQQGQQENQQLRVQLEQAARGGQGGGAATPEHHAQAVQVLALAQQTADQHLAQAKSESDRLLSEAQARAEQTLASSKAQSDRSVSEAQSRAEQVQRESNARAAQVVQEAEQRANTISAQLEQRKSSLERRLEELRTFEREYRTRLKSYLESQLRDLESSSKAEPSDHAAQAH